MSPIHNSLPTDTFGDQRSSELGYWVVGVLMVLLRQPACPATLPQEVQQPPKSLQLQAVLCWAGLAQVLYIATCLPQPCLYLTPLSSGRNVSMLVSAEISQSCFSSGTQACLELCYYSNAMPDFFVYLVSNMFLQLQHSGDFSVTFLLLLWGRIAQC